jgi:hypothetical protein
VNVLAAAILEIEFIADDAGSETINAATCRDKETNCLFMQAC